MGLCFIQPGKEFQVFSAKWVTRKSFSDFFSGSSGPPGNLQIKTMCSSKVVWSKANSKVDLLVHLLLTLKMKAKVYGYQ